MESLRNKMFQDGSRLTSLESIDAKSQIVSHNWTFGRRRRAIFQHRMRTHRRRLGESATIFSVRLSVKNAKTEDRHVSDMFSISMEMVFASLEELLVSLPADFDDVVDINASLTAAERPVKVHRFKSADFLG